MRLTCSFLTKVDLSAREPDLTSVPPDSRETPTRLTPSAGTGGPFVPNEAVVRLTRERDDLLLLHEALAEVDRAPTVAMRLGIFVRAIQRIGFGRVVMTIRDAQLNPLDIITAGFTPDEDHLLRVASTPGIVWRRRLDQMERFAISQSYYLNASDHWVADEFNAALPNRPMVDPHRDWSPRDFLVVPLRDAQGSIVATLMLDDLKDQSRPTLARVRTVELFGQQVASLLERVRLVEVAERRAARLQRLQRAGNALARSLDEADIVRELAHEVEQLVAAEGVAIVLRRANTGSPCRYDSVGDAIPIALELSCRTFCDLVVDTAAPQRLSVQDAMGASVLAVPALSGAAIEAIILVWSSRPSACSAEDEEVLLTVGAQAATALSNARMYAERQKEQQRAEALADIARAITASLRLDEVVQLGLAHATALLGANGATLGLLRDSEIHIVGAVGDGNSLLETRVPLHGSLSGRCLAQRTSMISNDSATDAGAYRPSILAADVRRTLMVPLFTGDRAIGVLAVINRVIPFDAQDAAVLQRLADHVAIAIANAGLFEENSALAERYRSVVETTADAIVITNRERRIVFTNTAAERLFANPGGANTQLVRLFVDPVDQARIAHFEDLALAGEPQRYETSIIRGDRERRFVSISTSPMWAGSTVSGIVASLRDITEEKQARDAVVQSQARYTRLVEAAADGIFTADKEGLITSVNRALERSVGRTRSQLLGTPFAALLDARDQRAAMQLFRESFAGLRRRGDLRYRAANGESRNCSVTATPIQEGNGVVGVLGIVRDVTEEKRLNDQLVQQEKLAAVGQLVSGVAHELNNPLAGVMAFSQLLLAAPTAVAEHRRAIETIHQEATRAAKIVANLLTFARQHQPERAPTDLNKVLAETLELRRYALRVGQISVVLKLDPLLPLTWADGFQLQQVALNLIVNAEQALDGWQGDRRILLGTEAKGQTLSMIVSDTGPGIASEHLSRIFNPFFTTKGVGQGTGLGLSISDGIVREHGGRIRVESRTGVGATFIVELPCVSAPEAVPPPARAAELEPGAARRILIVDDEPAIRSAISTYLRSLGHTVDAFSSAREVLAAVATVSYDALVLDLRMPDMSGDVLFAELQATTPELARRVVFLTGDMQSEAARAFLSSTGRPAVSKPFLLDELAAVVLAEASA